MYSNIVFDVDGTLIDTRFADLSSLHDLILEIQGKDVPIDDLRFAFGITSEDALVRLGIEPTEYYVMRWQSNYYRYADTVVAFSGLSEALKKMSEMSVNLGIITSRTKEEYALGFVPVGLAHFFSNVICSDDTENHKPSPEPMLKYLSLSKARPEEVLYVGDTIYDMQCAHDAGVDFALAVWGAHATDGIDAEHFLYKPSDLIDLVVRNS